MERRPMAHLLGNPISISSGLSDHAKASLCCCHQGAKLFLLILTATITGAISMIQHLLFLASVWSLPLIVGKKRQPLRQHKNPAG
jgi:hypothetical protein